MKHHKALVANAHAESVATYQEALAWCFKHLRVDQLDAIRLNGDLPLVARFICDCYWRSHEHFRRDVRKLWNMGGR